MNIGHLTAAAVLSLASASVVLAVAGGSDESLPLGAPSAVGVPTPAPEGALTGMVAQVGPLILVLALILGAALLVRKMAKGNPGLAAALGPGGSAPSGILEVLGRYPAAKGQSLVLLKLDRRILLLGQSYGGKGTGGFTTLCEIKEPEEVASILIKVNQSEGKSMEAYLQEAMAQMESHGDVAEVSAESARRAGATRLGGGAGTSPLWGRLGGWMKRADGHRGERA